MSAFLVAAAVGVFFSGLVVGALLTLAVVRDKINAMNTAASEAHDMIAAHSGGALRDLVDAHSKTEAMIGAVEAARSSTTRAEMSVARLMKEIETSRDNFDDVASRRWVGFTRAPRRPPPTAPEQHLTPPIS